MFENENNKVIKLNNLTAIYIYIKRIKEYKYNFDDDYFSLRKIVNEIEIEL
jgi:hypothetical protein